MSTYEVTFDRIGRTRGLAPLTVSGDSEQELAAAIHKFAKRYLVSSDTDVEVMLREDKLNGLGYITAGFRDAGTFMMRQVDA